MLCLCQLLEVVHIAWLVAPSFTFKASCVVIKGGDLSNLLPASHSLL